jgi:hypothetical protein
MGVAAMRGNTQVNRRYCPECEKETKCQRNAIEWGAGDLILILCTIGLWVPAKYALAAALNPWRCSDCGSKVR